MLKNRINSIYNFCFIFLGLYFTFFYLGIEGLEVSQERKALSQAIEKKNSGLVKSIMESYSLSIDALSEESKTPLMEATYCGDLESVHYFIAKGANVNFEEESSVWNTPLKNALAIFWLKGDNLVGDIIQALINAGAEVNEPISSWRPSSFMQACAENALKCVQIFINAGVSLEAQTSEGKTALMFASESGKCEVASVLIEKGVNLEQKDYKGKTAIFYAIEKKSPFLVNILIGSGANISLRDAEGTTPFMYAAASEMPGLIEIFFQIKTDFKAVNYKNQSALFFVARTNDIQSASFLLDQGLKIDQKDKNGYTPFLESVHANKLEMAKFLIEKGANAAVKDYKGVSAVYPAAKNGNLELLQILIEKKAPLNTRGSYGFTPLMVAIINDHFYVVECLLAAGANTKACTTSSVTLTTFFPSWKKYSIPAYTTPLDLAKILERSNIVEILISKNNH